MNPLDTATLEELTDEIKRRAGHGVIVVAAYDPSKPNGYAVHLWGSSMWAIGACKFATNRAMEDLVCYPDSEPEKERPDALEP